jgi:hypothetical protein
MSAIDQSTTAAATVAGSTAESGSAVKSPMPSFVSLAKSASTAVLAAIAVALIMRRLGAAVSLASGLVICLAMYAGIYSFVTGATKIISGFVGGKAGVNAASYMPQFLFATVGKFIGIGIALYLMFKFLHINLLVMLGGFLIAQLAITVTSLRSLTDSPVLGGKPKRRT